MSDPLPPPVAPVSWVIKRDGRHEEFSREKLLSGIRKACQKRPVTPKAMEDLVDHIIATVTAKFETEVPGEFIGTMVMEGLREIDSVAYVRFASVYRSFNDIDEFMHELEDLIKQRKPGPSASPSDKKSGSVS